jgi:hypothetical protein
MGCRQLILLNNFFRSEKLKRTPLGLVEDRWRDLASSLHTKEWTEFNPWRVAATGMIQQGLNHHKLHTTSSYRVAGSWCMIADVSHEFTTKNFTREMLLTRQALRVKFNIQTSICCLSSGWSMTRYLPIFIAVILITDAFLQLKTWLIEIKIYFRISKIDKSISSRSRKLWTVWSWI